MTRIIADCIHEAFQRGRASMPFRGIAGPDFQSQTYVAHAVGQWLAENDGDPDAQVVGVHGYRITVESFSGVWVYWMDAAGALQWAEDVPLAAGLADEPPYHDGGR